MTLRFGNNTISRAPQQSSAPVVAPLARAFFVGRTERGPVNVPTRSRDFDEFRQTFGAGSVAGSTSEMAEVANDYFRTVGNLADCITLRLFEGDAVAATAKEPAAAGAAKVIAVAPGPGLYGNALRRSFILAGTAGVDQTLTVSAQEVVNGVIVANRDAPPVPLTDDGIATANRYLAGVITLVFDPLGTAPVLTPSTAGVAPTWVSLAGGTDSVALTTPTLVGTVNDDTQVRTGLELLRASKFGGGVLVAAGFESSDGRAAKYAWAASTFRFVPECPPSDMLTSGALADYAAARTVAGAEFAAYYYPRGRTLRNGRYASRSPLGAIAGVIVASVMRKVGYVAPPAGETVLRDTQASTDGVTPLVTDANMAALQAKGLNVLVSRSRVEMQGLSLIAPDPLSAATTKIHHRLVVNACAYLLGPVLSQFNNTYVDAKNAFYTAVEGELKKQVKPLFDSGVLYGVSLPDALQIKFDFLQSPAEVLEQTGRVAVSVKIKVSGVSEGIDLSLGQVTINTPFVG